MTEHTPGPWKLHGPSPGLDRAIDDGGDYAILTEGECIIAQAHHRVAKGVTVNALANARLMAAAPDLLAALRNIECNAYHESHVRSTAQAAIDKAERDNNR